MMSRNSSPKRNMQLCKPDPTLFRWQDRKEDEKMCLQAYAIPAQENRVSAQRLSKLSGLRVEKLNNREGIRER